MNIYIYTHNCREHTKINTLELQRLLMVEGNIQFWEDFLGVFSRILMCPS
jgi:hypothetical protein